MEPSLFDSAALSMAQIAMIAVLIERAVAQVKNMVRTPLAKPWPLVALGISVALAWAYDLRAVEAILGTASGAGIGAGVDRILTAAVLSGGSAMAVSIYRAMQRRADQVAPQKGV